MEVVCQVRSTSAKTLTLTDTTTPQCGATEDAWRMTLTSTTTQNTVAPAVRTRVATPWLTSLGQSCAGDEICVDGLCACPMSFEVEFCSDTCTNTSSSTAHCGACGNSCNPGEVTRVFYRFWAPPFNCVDLCGGDV